MSQRRTKPWQYGLASLFWLTTAVAVVVWLDVPYWVHMGSVFVQVLVALAGVSLLGAAIVAPFALFAALRWIIEDSNWEVLLDQVRNRLRRSKDRDKRPNRRPQ